jgi:hypothetical protein
MTDEASEYFQQANNFLVEVMFFAAPTELVSLKNEKIKYLYTISCLQIIESGEYIIFHKVFKPLKKKNKQGFMFSAQDSTTQLFKHINEANDYVHEFINLFNEHTRQLNNLSDDDSNLPAGNAILIINSWEKSALERFNQIVIDSLKR